MDTEIHPLHILLNEVKISMPQVSYTDKVDLFTLTNDIRNVCTEEICAYLCNFM